MKKPLEKEKLFFIWRCNNSVVKKIEVEQKKMQYVCFVVDGCDLMQDKENAVKGKHLPKQRWYWVKRYVLG